jgi:hypothetical protein
LLGLASFHGRAISITPPFCVGASKEGFFFTKKLELAEAIGFSFFFQNFTNAALLSM